MTGEKIFGVKGSMIEGVVVKKLARIPDERGCIYHMLKQTDEIFEKFGEIYFSSIYPNAIKGWHLHKRMTLNYVTIIGMIKLVLYDNRENSPTKGNLMEIFMGDQNYLLVKIPPGIWNGFKGISKKETLIANCSTHPHDPNEIPSEMERLDPFSDQIVYDWGIKNE